jgi:hypothetical protein
VHGGDSVGRHARGLSWPRSGWPVAAGAGYTGGDADARGGCRRGGHVFGSRAGQGCLDRGSVPAAGATVGCSRCPGVGGVRWRTARTREFMPGIRTPLTTTSIPAGEDRVEQRGELAVPVAHQVVVTSATQSWFGPAVVKSRLTESGAGVCRVDPPRHPQRRILRTVAVRPNNCVQPEYRTSRTALRPTPTSGDAGPAKSARLVPVNRSERLTGRKPPWSPTHRSARRVPA